MNNNEVLNYIEDNPNNVETFDENVVPDESKFRRLYIDGMPLTTTENEIKTYFETWGEIEECLLTTNATTILCCLKFAFATSIDVIQANRPHKIKNTIVETRRMLPDGYPVRKLYVGSIKGGTTTGHIFAVFSRFGRVRAVDMIKDKLTGRCRGFCFVSFDDYDSADKCLLAIPHVLNRKVVRVQKAIPISEMMKLSVESGNSENEVSANSKMSVDHKPARNRESRNSVSSADTDFSETSSFENPSEHAYPCCTQGGYPQRRKELDFSNSKPVRHYSYPAYNRHCAKDTKDNFSPSSLSLRNCSNYKPGMNNVKAPYMNVSSNYFVPYMNKSTPTSIQCPLYSNTSSVHFIQPNSYPHRYNLACPDVRNLNFCLPFVSKTNESVSYVPLPTAMLIPVSLMCNYARPGFVGSCQNPYG